MEQSGSEIDRPPTDGVYVYGLFMEGEIWDRHGKNLGNQKPGEMYETLPAIHFIPTENYKQPPNTYACPVYKTSVRAGVLSTTGQSTNFVVSIDFPTKKTQEYWTLRGTAVLCQLND